MHITNENCAQPLARHMIGVINSTTLLKSVAVGIGKDIKPVEDHDDDIGTIGTPMDTKEVVTGMTDKERDEVFSAQISAQALNDSQ